MRTILRAIVAATFLVALPAHALGPVPAASAPSVAVRPSILPTPPVTVAVRPAFAVPARPVFASPARPPFARPAAPLPVAPSAIPKVAPLTPQQHEELVKAGRELVTRQTERVTKLLPTSGFNSLDDLAKAVAAMGPDRARVVDFVKNEHNFEFAMNRKEDARDGIAAAGFLNQYEVGRSSGTFSPQMRIQAEAHFLGMSPTDYANDSPRLRAKYGYLRPSEDSGVSMVDPAGSYGSDTFVFKPDAVKDHVTFWPYDTLGAAAGAGAATKWDQAFLPWSQRLLLAPSLTLQGKQLARGNQFPPGFHADYPETMYVELQYWRPLGLEDVQRFEFATNPPRGDFLKALRADGVKIFQKGVAAEWTGDSAVPATAPLMVPVATPPRVVVPAPASPPAPAVRPPTPMPAPGMAAAPTFAAPAVPDPRLSAWLQKGGPGLERVAYVPVGVRDPSRDGSNGGRWFKDGAGGDWFGKPGKGDAADLDRIGNELAVNKIYRVAGDAFGISAPATRPGLVDGKPYLMSQKLAVVPAESFTPDQLRRFGDGFVVDAWLANWDAGVQGQLMSDGSGRLVRIDSGGGGLFHARGAPKGAAFTDQVTELTTMREPARPSSFAFRSLSEADVKQELQKFAAWYPAHHGEVDAAIDSSGLSAAAGAELKSKLATRAEWLIQQSTK